MARLVPSGTPSRTRQYVYPRRKLRLFVASLTGGIGAAALLLVAFFQGVTTVASPGQLASAHAPFEKKCAACHSPSVADARCEYCHDPFSTNRYQNAGHVWFGTKDARAIARAAIVDCARCHTDHRGRDFRVVPKDDRQCRNCHFPSFVKHPEFALVRAGSMKDEGLEFSHKSHLKAVKKAKLEECQYCHEATHDQRSFQPLNFDQHCAKCHLLRGSIGSTESVPADALLLPQQIDASWARARGRIEPDRSGKVTVTNLAHKDPWILFNVWKIAGEVDPQGIAARRAAVEQRIRELTLNLKDPPSEEISIEDLKEEEKRLGGQIAQLSQGGGGAGERKQAERALSRLRVQIEFGPSRRPALRPRGRSQLVAELRQLQADLANLEIASRSIRLSADQREQRLTALSAMNAPCMLCHVSRGALMAPVRAGISALNRATFSHLPHLRQLGCQACHARIAESKKAENVNLPGIATCQSCHRTGKSRSDCAVCHAYHPPDAPWPPI